MVKVSYEQKPFRREVMRTYGAKVTPSPSTTTEVGKKILAEHPGTTGSLGCAISEAVEAESRQEGYRYVLGSVLNQVLLHQTVIGLETKAALENMILFLILSSDVPVAAQTSAVLFLHLPVKCSAVNMTIRLLRLNLHHAQVLQEACLHMISAIQERYALLLRCIHSEADLSLLPTTPADYATTV